MRLFNHCIGNDRTVLEHILQIHQIAVVHMLCEIVGVMEVNNAFLVRLDNIFGQQNAFRQVFRDFSCHIIALNGVYSRIFIGVFLLDFLVVAFNQRKNLVVGCIGNTRQITGKTVTDVPFRRFGCTLQNDVRFDKLLHLFHR